LTDGRTDRQADRIIIARLRLHSMSAVKIRDSTYAYTVSERTIVRTGRDLRAYAPVLTRD